MITFCIVMAFNLFYSVAYSRAYFECLTFKAPEKWLSLFIYIYTLFGFVCLAIDLSS